MDLIAKSMPLFMPIGHIEREQIHSISCHADCIDVLADKSAKRRWDSNGTQLRWVLGVLFKAKEISVSEVALDNRWDPPLEDEVEQALQVGVDFRNVQGHQIDEGVDRVSRGSASRALGRVLDRFQASPGRKYSSASVVGTGGW